MSTRPSITVWNDPDTGKPITRTGPTGFLSRTTRLGSAFTETAPPPPVAVPASPPVRSEPADVTALKLEIRRLKGSVDTAEDAVAAEALRDLTVMRDAEYARPDGGRIAIKRALSSVGIGKPE